MTAPMSKALQPVRGTHDLLPEDFVRHQFVVRTAQEVAARYGFKPIDTPIFEFSEVFHRAVGETSDIVTKETYSFTDRGGESITLRPEFTAGIVRAYISNGLQQHAPFKCFAHGPAFRYERPQKGRQRQFHQIDCEILGSNQPTADVEIIALAAHMLRELGLLEYTTLEINSLGDAESRANYREALVNYFAQHKDKLSADSQMRLEKNPLRILDSKNEGDRALIAGAPVLHDYFTDAARDYFSTVENGLDMLGIAFRISPALVRGLDYYSHTVFEFTTDKLGAQGTVLAGGRYNDLATLLGGPETACIGFAAGVERLVGLCEAAGLEPKSDESPFLIAVIPLNESAEADAWLLAQFLRYLGLRVDIAYKGNAKKRFERANKQGAIVAMLLGEEEVIANTVTMKHLKTGVQETVPRGRMGAKLKEMLGVV